VFLLFFSFLFLEGVDRRLSIFSMIAYFWSRHAEWHWHAWTKIPETTWKFQHLRPFTTYKFRVNLRSHGFVYNGTSTAQTTTSPAIPSAPRITNLEQTNAGLVLSWTKPGATNGALKNYIIEISVDDNIETLETDGPVQNYVMDTQQFNAGQKVTFRVRAVNSHFKGDFSEAKDLEIGHAILQDAISQLEIVATAELGARGGSCAEAEENGVAAEAPEARAARARSIDQYNKDHLS